MNHMFKVGEKVVSTFPITRGMKAVVVRYGKPEVNVIRFEGGASPNTGSREYDSNGVFTGNYLYIDSNLKHVAPPRLFDLEVEV